MSRSRAWLAAAGLIGLAADEFTNRVQVALLVHDAE
jgi:hypothetical protein